MRRFLSLSIFTLTILAVSSGVASAQTGQLRGTVKLIGKDGNAAPVAGAEIDVYRTDISGEFHTKSDKKGEWVFAGLPFVGTYTVSISAPGASPMTKAGIRARANTPVDVVLTPGNGKKLTEAEALAASKGDASSGNTGGDSTADKAKAEEMKKENEKISKENEKISNSNKVIADSFKNGNT